MLRKFEKIHIEITNVCNLQCSFCPEVVRTKKLMDTPLFERILKQIAPLTGQVALHLMGDPLLHPQLEPFIQLCADHNLKINFVTNGVLLKPGKAELLLHPTVRQVNFSVHSFADNFPDKDPTDYLDRLFSFTDAAFERRPDLYINYRLWNLQHASSSAERNRDMLKRISDRFAFELPSTINVKEQKSYRIKNRLYLHFDTEFTWPSLDLPTLGSAGTCYGLRSHFGILADGTVVPCCLDKEASIPLGNLQDQSIDEILNSPRARQMVDGFQKRRLTEELCRRCNYIERFKTPGELYG